MAAIERKFNLQVPSSTENLALIRELSACRVLESPPPQEVHSPSSERAAPDDSTPSSPAGCTEHP